MAEQDLIVASELEGSSGASNIGMETPADFTSTDLQEFADQAALLLSQRISRIMEEGVELSTPGSNAPVVNFFGDGIFASWNTVAQRYDVEVPGAESIAHIAKATLSGVEIGEASILNFTGAHVDMAYDVANDRYNVEFTVPDIPVVIPATDADQGIVTLSVPAADPDDPISVGDNDPRLDLATDSIYGRAKLSVPAANPAQPKVVGDNDPRMGLATDSVIGRSKLSVPAADPAQPKAVGDNDPRLSLATNLLAGRAKLTVAAVDSADPKAVGDNDPRLALATASTFGRVKLSAVPADSANPVVVGDNDPRLEAGGTPDDGSVTAPKAATDIAFVILCTSSTRPGTAKHGQLIFETDTNNLLKQVATNPLFPDWQPPTNITDLPLADDGESNPNEIPRASDIRLSNARIPLAGSVGIVHADADTSVIHICDSTTRPVSPKRGQLIYELDSALVMKQISDPATPNWQPVGTGAANVTFQEEGSTIAQRATVNFVGEGATVMDDSVNSKTQVAIPGLKVQSAGADVATHATLNITGATVTNDGGNSRVNVVIPAGAASSETIAGLIEIATQTETEANTDDQRALTPLKHATHPHAMLKASQVQADAGTNDTLYLTPLKHATQPHGFLKASQGQADAGTDDALYLTSLKHATQPHGFLKASQSQVDAGTDDALYVTSLKLATKPQKNLVFETFITGLQLQWNSPGTNGTNLTVTPGAAWIPSLGRIYNVPSTITGPSMTFSASTWYHIYLYDNAGTPAIEIVSNASGPPSAVYKGSARTRTSDTSRRLLGQVRTDASGSPRMWNFWHEGDFVRYREAYHQTPFMTYSTGSSVTTLQTVSAAAVVPSIARVVFSGFYASATFLSIGAPDDSISNALTTDPFGMLFAQSGVVGWGFHTLDSSQQYEIQAGATGSTVYCSQVGYISPR